jgi:hypothetical protein
MRWSWVRQYGTIQGASALGVIFLFLTSDVVSNLDFRTFFGFDFVVLSLILFLASAFAFFVGQLFFFVAAPPRPKTYASLAAYLTRFVGETESAYKLRIEERQKYVDEDRSRPAWLAVVNFFILCSALFFLSGLTTFSLLLLANL